MEKIRQPAVAGRFYTANPTDLAAEVRSFLGLAPGDASGQRSGAGGSHINRREGGQTLGMLLPHAGYIFSGAVAGLTLRELLNEPGPLPDLFVLLGPSHTGRGAPLAVWPDGAWRTPLGDMPVDASFIAALLQGEDQSASSAENTATVRQTDAPNTSPSALFKADQAAHLGEHAIEVILPFLQEIAPQAAIVPICVADYNLEHLRRAGKLLAETIARRDARFSKKLDKENENGGKPGSDKTDNRRRICLITSSDMNHFLPHEQNMRLDALALDRLRAMDPEGLFKVVREKGISMCGFAPACLMLFACLELGAKNCRVTAHTSSGITGQSFGADMGRVVGYAGALID